MSNPPVIVWFRKDLRFADNPALHAAAATGHPVVGVFVFDDSDTNGIGAAQKWWLHESLVSLGAAADAQGWQLILRRGDSAQVIGNAVSEIGASAIFWNRRYAPTEIDVDKNLKAKLIGRGIDVKTFNGSLIHEPWTVRTKTDTSFKVFTPFWRKFQSLEAAQRPILTRPDINKTSRVETGSDPIDQWMLQPKAPDWAVAFRSFWQPGEGPAREKLSEFLREGIHGYERERDFPALTASSGLSPHLALGEISPNLIWAMTMDKIKSGEVNEKVGLKFLSEIAWREFSYHLLYHHQDLPTRPFKKQFDAFPWRDDRQSLSAWQSGKTGIPIVDAGMRELWQTGWMHNRVRMVTASFLTKNLLIDWRHGAKWFWDCLVDADIASNSASWQWVSGSGADAAPYFRIFNPVRQGEKFDPDGQYVRRFVPELANVPSKYIHQPWAAPDDVLDASGVRLGQTYPAPLVDLKYTRDRALAAYDDIKNPPEQNKQTNIDESLLN